MNPGMLAAARPNSYSNFSVAVGVKNDVISVSLNYCIEWVGKANGVTYYALVGYY